MTALTADYPTTPPSGATASAVPGDGPYRIVLARLQRLVAYRAQLARRSAQTPPATSAVLVEMVRVGHMIREVHRAVSLNAGARLVAQRIDPEARPTSPPVPRRPSPASGPAPARPPLPGALAVPAASSGARGALGVPRGADQELPRPPAPGTGDGIDFSTRHPAAPPRDPQRQRLLQPCPVLGGCPRRSSNIGFTSPTRSAPGATRIRPTWATAPASDRRRRRPSPPRSPPARAPPSAPRRWSPP